MKTKVLVLVSIFILLLVFLSYGAYTRVEKIGIVDIDDVVDAFLEGKDIAKDFNNYKYQAKIRLASMEAEINSIRKSLLEISNQIVKSTNNSTNSYVDYSFYSEYKKLSDEYNMKVEAYKNEVERVNKEIVSMRNNLMRYVIRDVLDYIRDYGTRKGYTLIIERGSGRILFVSPGSDVTSDLASYIKAQEATKNKY